MEGESLSIVHEAMAMLRVIVPFGLRIVTSTSVSASRASVPSTARVDLTVRQTVFSVVVNVLTAHRHRPGAGLRCLPDTPGPTTAVDAYWS